MIIVLANKYPFTIADSI